MHEFLISLDASGMTHVCRIHAMIGEERGILSLRSKDAATACRELRAAATCGKATNREGRAGCLFEDLMAPLR